jgi:hypothetical protein
VSLSLLSTIEPLVEWRLAYKRRLIALDGVEIISEIRVRRTFAEQDLHKIAQRHWLSGRRESQLRIGLLDHTERVLGLIVTVSFRQTLLGEAQPIGALRIVARHHHCHRRAGLKLEWLIQLDVLTVEVGTQGDVFHASKDSTVSDRRHPIAGRSATPPPYSPLSAVVISRSVFFASPSTIIVFGLPNRSFSMPAKPGLKLRLSTITARACSTLNTGMP